MIRTLEDFVAEAARQLKSGGWDIAQRDSHGDVWHIVARRGMKWRVVQVLVPATELATRQRDKLRLGNAAQLSFRAGSMEQWLAHIRPGGHVTFGRDVLRGTAWDGNETDQQVGARLNPVPSAGEPVVPVPAMAAGDAP